MREREREGGREGGREREREGEREREREREAYSQTEKVQRGTGAYMRTMASLWETNVFLGPKTADYTPSARLQSHTYTGKPISRVAKAGFTVHTVQTKLTEQDKYTSPSPTYLSVSHN